MHTSSSTPKRVRTARAAGLQALVEPRPKAALAHELAFAVRHDDLEPPRFSGQGGAQGVHHLLHGVGPDPAHPLHPDAAQGVLDALARPRARFGEGAAGERAGSRLRSGMGRRDRLSAGCGGVSVVHDDEHVVGLVVDRARDAGGEAVVPEPAVAHDAHGTLAHVGADGGRARQPQPVAEHGVADVEGRQCGERMATDVGAHVHVPDLALHDLQRAEHRALRATGAESGRTVRNGCGEDLGSAAPGVVHRPDDSRVRRIVVAEHLAQERVHPAQHDLARVLAGHRERTLPEELRVHVGPAKETPDCFLQIVGLAFLHDQHGTLARTESRNLLWNERVGDVEDEDGDSRPTLAVGETEERQRAERGIVHPALGDDSDVADCVGARRRKILVQTVFPDELDGGRPALHAPSPAPGSRWRAAGRCAGSRSAGHPGACGWSRPARGSLLVAKLPWTWHARIRSSSITGVLLASESSKAFLHGSHHGGQARSRVEQPHLRLHGEGVASLLDDARSVAVVLADHDEGAAGHPGRRQIRERIGGDVGAHRRLPHRASAHGVVDRSGKHGAGGGLVRARLDVHPEGIEDLAGVVEDVHHVGDRRALIASDVGNSGLEQCLCDREDSLAVKDVSVAEPERPDLLRKASFRHPGTAS